MRPETKYAVSGGYSIAWQAIGDGPDVVMIPGFVSNVEVVWEIPAAARFLERLASFCRLIVFDKRGTGLSDRVPIEHLPSLEDRIDDVRAVMDAAQSESAVLFGISEGGPMAALFAGTYPDRVEGLILYGSYARRAAATSAADQLEPFVARIEREWGNGTVLAERSGTVAEGRGMTRALGRLERHSATPAAAAAIVRMGYEIDVTDVLSSVSAPTLVLHRSADPNIKIDGGRALARGIPGARLVELPGTDHIPFFGEPDALLTEIEEFVTGDRPEAMPARSGEVKRRGDDLVGLAVHIAARVGAAAGDGEVWVSRTVRDLTAGSSLSFTDRGRHSFKGVPDEWRVYAADYG